MRKKEDAIGKAAVAASILLFLAAGCVKTPETEYITNKEGLGNLVSNNSTNDDGVPLMQQVKAPERVMWNCESANAYTEVGIHASVIIPNATAIPVYQIQQKQIDSELLETYAANLFGEQIRNPVKHEEGSYDRTQEALMLEIECLTEYIERGCYLDGTPFGEVYHYDEGIEVDYIDDLRLSIQEDYQFMEYAPKETEYGNPVDYSFGDKRNEGLWDSSTNLSADYELEKAGVIGKYNDKEYSLTFERDNVNFGIHFELYPIQETAYDCPYQNLRIWKHGEHLQMKDMENTCSYSKEEAVELCQDFLSQLGMENMTVGELEEIDLINSNSVEEIMLGNEGYWITFVRSYDSIHDMGGSEKSDPFITSDGTSTGGYVVAGCQAFLGKEFTNWAKNTTQEEEGFVLPRIQETTGFIVTDDGVAYAYILNPMETQACLAENVKLLDFAQIQSQAEIQMTNLYADQGSEKLHRKYNATIVELNYATMQAPDQDGEYTMVPVWDFRHNEKVLVTINAIDGSVFDRTKGY